MSKIFDLPLEKYKNLNIKLSPLPTEYIQINFTNKNCETINECPQPFSRSQIYTSSIESSQILAKADDIKTVYSIDLKFENDKVIEFRPGDTIGILPNNTEEDVNFIIDRLKLRENCDLTFELKIKENSKKSVKLPIFVPVLFTIQRTIRECLDLYGVPKKLFLRHLANYTSDPDEQLFLNILSSQQGKEEYDRIFIKCNKNVLDILKELKTCHPSFSTLLEHLPRLMPRPYSIASSPLKHSNTIRIIFSISGLATRFLESKLNDTSNRKINFYFRSTNTFRFDNFDTTNNLIMISAGTGIAPFIGFIEHIAQLNVSFKNVWLLTGYRYKNRNNICYPLFDEWLKLGVLTKLLQSFSRDVDSQYKYVQDQIKPNAIEFIEMLHMADTKILICGDGRTMVPDTEKTIVECLMDVKGMSFEDAVSFVNNLRHAGQYLEDKWI